MTKLQLGVVDVEASIAYRFALAGITLVAALELRGLRFRFRAADHAFIAAQGLCLFCLNSLAGYNAAKVLTSGLVAVVISTVVILNIVGLAVFFRAPVQPRLLLGAAISMVGLGLVFHRDVSTLRATGGALQGIALSLGGAVLISLGNMIAVRNNRRELPVPQTTALAMLYGATFAGLAVVFTGKTFGFDLSTTYVGSLLYLAIPGTALSFLLYLILLSRIGADRAAYVTVLYPVVALGISTVFEGYTWTPAALGGLALLLAGNVVALSAGARRGRAPGAA